MQRFDFCILRKEGVMTPKKMQEENTKNWLGILTCMTQTLSSEKIYTRKIFSSSQSTVG